jgi:hypothetical protein
MSFITTEKNVLFEPKCIKGPLMEIIVILRFGEFYLSPSSKDAGLLFVMRK